MKRFKNEMMDLLNSMGGLLCYGWPIILLVAVCLYGEYHHKCNQEQQQHTAFIQQAIRDDEIWSLLEKGGGMVENNMDYYVVVLPYGADASRLVAYYKATMEHPVSSETRAVLEVLQTRGIVYTRVYVGDHTRVDEAIRTAHPELPLDFNLQNRPLPHTLR